MNTRLLCILCCFLFLFSCAEKKTTPAPVYDKLMGLYESQRCFLFNAYLDSVHENLSSRDQVFFDLLRSSFFINDSLFLVCCKAINDKYYTKFTDKEKSIYHNNRTAFYARNGEYKQALKEVQIINGQFSDLIDSFELKDCQELEELYMLLQDCKAPSVNIPGVSSITLKKNHSLWYIPVNINGQQKDLVFDTGCGTSVIRKSLAEKVGMTIYLSNSRILNSTGDNFESSIAVADSLLLGEIIYRNIVFDCLEDSLLTFYNGKIVIDGILGMNVMSMTREFTLTSEAQLAIPDKPSRYSDKNFAWPRMQFYICITYEGDTIPVKFDTGSYLTQFFAPLYIVYSDSISENCESRSAIYGGIGGDSTYKTFDQFILTESRIGINDTFIILKNLPVHKEYIHNDREQHFGLFGMDFLQHFESVTISFAQNHVEFKGR